MAGGDPAQALIEERIVDSQRSPGKMKTFLTIWLGQVVSLVGSGLTGFALGVWVFEQTGSATQFALIGLSAVLPRVLLSPLAGASSTAGIAAG